MKFIDHLSRMPRPHLKLAGFATVLILGFIDYTTGPQLALSIFYLIPVCAFAWFVGRGAGIFMAILCGGVWLASEMLDQINYSHPLIPYWNAVVRWGIFLISSTLTSEIVARKEIEKQLRKAQQEAENQVRERTAELEHKKLLEKQIAEISEREQRRMGQDLHDGLCQHLVSVAFASAVLRERLAEKKLEEANDVNRIAEMLNDGITQARSLARGLYPVRLEVDGLSSALEELAENLSGTGKISCRFSCEYPSFIHDLTAGTNLYRIAQEAAVNAFKHANAQNISIELSTINNEVKLIVSDDGIGLPSSLKGNGGMGLHIMRYRARMIGATLDISRGSQSGTKVVCSFQNSRRNNF